MTKKNIRRLMIALGLVVAFLVGVGIFRVAESFILHSYSSGEVVLENTPEESTIPLEEGKVISDIERVSEFPDAVYPSYVYKEEGIVMRSREYLGAEYVDYEDMFNGIVGLGDEPFKELDNSNEYLITMEMNDVGLNVAMGLMGIDEALDDYDYCILGLDESGATRGAEAVYCYNGSRVVYKLDTVKPSFFVVDYSNSSVDKNTDLVEFGGLFTDYLYLIPEKCSKQEIDGYTVYFSYNIYVDTEW